MRRGDVILSIEGNRINSVPELQEQVARAFIYYTNEGTFEDSPATVRLLSGVLPLIDRAAENAKFVAETTVELLLQLREGLEALRDELSQAREK